MEYAFPSNPSDELFPFVYFAVYSNLTGCRPHNSFSPRTSVSLFQFLSNHLSSHVTCVPQQLNFRQNGEFRRYHVESLLDSTMLSSIHATIIITNALSNQTGSYYI